MIEELLWKINQPFSNNSFLLIRQGVLSEGEHHQPGAVHQHHRTAILWIYAHYRDVYILDKAILNMKQTTKRTLNRQLPFIALVKDTSLKKQMVS